MWLVDFVRRVAEFAAAEIRIDEGWQAANRKGSAAMTRKTYCGNLLWQSSLTLLVPKSVQYFNHCFSARHHLPPGEGRKRK